MAIIRFAMFLTSVPVASGRVHDCRNADADLNSGRHTLIPAYQPTYIPCNILGGALGRSQRGLHLQSRGCEESTVIDEGKKGGRRLPDGTYQPTATKLSVGDSAMQAELEAVQERNDASRMMQGVKRAEMDSEHADATRKWNVGCKCK